MAVITKYGIMKKIILLVLLIVITANFIMPNYIHAIEATEENAQGAVDDYSNQASTILDDIQNLLGIEDSINDENSEGGALFTPITDFLVGVADSVMGTLQSVFLEDRKILSNIISADSIKLKGPAGNKNINFYIIKYSPATIFAGNVPTFDVNFFEPQGDSNGKVDIKKSSINYSNAGNYTYQQCKDNFGAPDSVNIHYDKTSTTEIILRVISLVCAIDAIEAIGNFNIGIGLEVEATVGSLISAAAFGVLSTISGSAANLLMLTRQTVYWRMWQDETTNIWYFWVSTQNLALDQIVNLFTNIENKQGTLYQISENIKTYTKDSTAFKLRSVIATWYIAVRNFALVALLSVLVYIGIRIILSSKSAENKAKYKNMLVDWLTAICILFVLHYLMAFVLNITEKITEMFKVTTVSEGGIDYLMTTIRNSIVQRNGSIFNYWGYVIMYITLVILTISFTFEYIKRLIFLALLTMIAPLIALTYPLDKIRDNQAQGFNLWLREYVFNCLIRPLHLLLYTMIVTTAIKTMNNPIIAIIALALFKPAENFLRKLFGFDKATTMNNFGTIAGGAMVMNMLNKLPKGRKEQSKDSKKDAENKNSVRMNTNEINTNETQSSKPYLATGNSIFSNGTSNQKQSRKNGYKAVGNKVLKSVPNGLAKGMRWTSKAAMKAGGALAGTMIGIATGAADGEIGLPIKNIAAGIYAGGKTGETIMDKTEEKSKKMINGMGNTIDNINETYQKGKMGEENYNKQKKEQEFYSSDGWKRILNDSAIQGDKTAKTEEFLHNGIFAPEVIKEALENEISAKNYIEYSNVGIDKIKDMAKLQDAGIKPQDYAEFEKYGIQDVNKISRVKNKHKSKTSYEIARNMAIAQNGKELSGDSDTFIAMVRSFDKTITDDEAEEIRKQLGSYLI